MANNLTTFKHIGFETTGAEHFVIAGIHIVLLNIFSNIKI